jgi:hypothetical protein
VLNVNNAGIKRVKPSDRFIAKAKAISMIPAIESSVHDMWRFRFSFAW